MVQVEIDDEQAPLRIGEPAFGFGAVAGIETFVRRIGRVPDELERVDRLRLPVFENREISGGQALDDETVAARVRVDTNEVDGAAEDLVRWRGRSLRARRILCRQWRQRRGHEQATRGNIPNDSCGKVHG